MTAVALRIVAPAHGAAIAGTEPVRLRGELMSGSPTGLFFKWYSTLNAAASETAPQLNTGLSAAVLDWSTLLDVGTHVLTLAAADRAGSDLASTQAVTRAGFTGGAPAPANPAPCVIHRLVAVLRKPASNGTTLKKSDTTLEMNAPARWGKKADPQPPQPNAVYVPDSDYHAVNGIQYRFRLSPVGAPTGRKAAEWTPSLAELAFLGDDDPPCLRWRGALPVDVGTGLYTLELFVETRDGEAAHRVARTVTITA